MRVARWAGGERAAVPAGDGVGTVSGGTARRRQARRRQAHQQRQQPPQATLHLARGLRPDGRWSADALSGAQSRSIRSGVDISSFVSATPSVPLTLRWGGETASQASGRGPAGRKLLRRSLTLSGHQSSSDSQGSDAASPASALQRQGWSGGASAYSVMRKRPRAAHALSYEPSSVSGGGEGGGPGGGPVRSSTHMEPPSPLTTVWGATAKRRGFATMQLDHTHALLHQPPCTPRLSPEHAEPHAEPHAHHPAAAAATPDCGPSPGPSPPPETVAAILMSLTQPHS
jgi:hypothetical protein